MKKLISYPLKLEYSKNNGYSTIPETLNKEKGGINSQNAIKHSENGNVKMNKSN